MIIRSTVKPHEKSPEEASIDRTLPSPQPGPPPITPGSAGNGAGSPAVVQPGILFPNELDGCGVEAVDLTPDEDLPAATGGIAAV